MALLFEGPEHWGQDGLTRYLDMCIANQVATFANQRSAVIDLTTIDEMFTKLVSEDVNPNPLLPIDFLQRSHCAFLSACSAAMAGQLNEVPALLRVCLEHGGYANYVGTDQERWERWIDRHIPRSGSQLDKWRAEFTHGKVAGSVVAADANLGAAYKALYERTIDYGAHPNEKGASMSTMIEEADNGDTRFGTVYLHSDGVVQDRMLRFVASVGICVLGIAQVIYPFRMQAIGVKFQLATIAKRFPESGVA